MKTQFPFDPPSPPGSSTPGAGAGVPQPSHRATARSPRRRRRWLIAIVIAVPVLVAAGIVGYYVSQERQRAYDKGHAAYLVGNCADAVGPLDKVTGGRGDGRKDDELAARARAELDECAAFTAPAELGTSGHVADAILGYSAFVAKYPRSPMQPAALDGARQLVEGQPAEQVAAVDLCDGLDQLQAEHIIVNPAESRPPLLLACGRAYESIGDLTSALGALEQFRTDFPDHRLRADVDADFARISLAEADQTGSGSLGEPGAIGASGEAGGMATIEIHNDSDQPMVIVLHGPQTRVEELPACDGCQPSTGADRPCSPEAPVGRYVVDPGSYDTLIKSSGDVEVRPFRGTWTIEAGQAYASCFYIGAP